LWLLCVVEVEVGFEFEFGLFEFKFKFEDTGLETGVVEVEEGRW
jgi:hypothetical protein